MPTKIETIKLDKQGNIIMLLQFESIKALAAWMDSKHYPLIACYEGKIPGYPKARFLDELKELPEHISSDELGAKKYGWNEISFSRCLKGLKGMPAIVPVQKILEALTKKMEQSKAPWDAQAIGNALYGLKAMDASTSAVQRALNALADKISYSDAVLGAQAIIGNAFYGLQSMDASSPAVQKALNALADKIGHSDAVLDTQHIGNALYGLQRMSSSTPGVLTLLSYLNNQVIHSNPIPDTSLEWKQIVSSYLAIAKQSNSVVLSKELVHALFPAQKSRPQNEYSLKEIQTLFINKLKLAHFTKGTLDLHGLDYLSAIVLLHEGFKNRDGLNKIIFGAASHSKSTAKNKMKQVVGIYLTQHRIQGTYNHAFVRLPPKQNPPAALPFISKLNPTARPFTPQQDGNLPGHRQNI